MQEVKYQKGVGLLDILVALLLLAIAVLGFVALQLRAVEATAEGANRIQAMNIARDLAERLGSDYVVFSQGYKEGKEVKIKGRYIDKAVDITVKKREYCRCRFIG